MIENSKILVVEDEESISQLIGMVLKSGGFNNVKFAPDGVTALNMIEQWLPDVVLMDIMLPGMDGLTLCKHIKNNPRFNSVKVIMLTAMGNVEDRIIGLEVGADDYVAKPFEPKELLLRIGSILKRTPTEKKETQKLDLGQCVFDMQTKELASKQGEIMHITPIEQSLLGILGAKSGQVFSRDKLSEILGAGQSPRSIDVQITRLRKKIEKDSQNPRYLQTVRGKGYMLLPD